MRRVSEETRIADECCKSGGPRATARTMNFDIRETGRRIRARASAPPPSFFFFFRVRLVRQIYDGIISRRALSGRDDISIGQVKATRDIINDER